MIHTLFCLIAQLSKYNEMEQSAEICNTLIYSKAFEWSYSLCTGIHWYFERPQMKYYDIVSKKQNWIWEVL